MLLGFLSLLIGQFIANSVVPIGTKITAPEGVTLQLLIGGFFIFWVFSSQPPMNN